MRKKIIKCMLYVVDWVSEEIGNEVNTNAFITDIELDLLSIDEDIKGEDIIYHEYIDVFEGNEKFIDIVFSIDVENSPEIRIISKYLDEEGIKIENIIFTV